MSGARSRGSARSARLKIGEIVGFHIVVGLKTRAYGGGLGGFRGLGIGRLFAEADIHVDVVLVVADIVGAVARLFVVVALGRVTARAAAARVGERDAVRAAAKVRRRVERDARAELNLGDAARSHAHRLVMSHRAGRVILRREDRSEVATWVPTIIQLSAPRERLAVAVKSCVALGGGRGGRRGSARALFQPVAQAIFLRHRVTTHGTANRWCAGLTPISGQTCAAVKLSGQSLRQCERFVAADPRVLDLILI